MEKHRSIELSLSSWNEIFGRMAPEDRFIGTAGEMVVVSPTGTRLHIYYRPSEVRTGPNFKQKLGAMMGTIEKYQLPPDSYAIRARILMEAAEATCRYCAGVSGHDSPPTKRYGQWDHLFLTGNGSNPCGAGAIWNLIEQCCIQMGSQYTPWESGVHCPTGYSQKDHHEGNCMCPNL